MSHLCDDIEVKNIIESEGMDYAVQFYMSAEKCANPETAALWKAASEALAALALHLHLDED